MRVVAKFALLFLVATSLFVGIFAYRDVRREAADLRAEAKSDLRAFGEGLRAGAVAAAASGGTERALDVIRAACGERGDIDVSWIETGLGPQDSRAPEANEPQTVAARIPIAVGGRALGTLVLRRRMASERDLLRAALGEELVAAAALILCLGVLSVLLGGALIGRPLQRVVAQAKRIGSGDLSQRLAGNASGELGDLKRAINRMCDQLASARDQLERESTARVETLEQLRHLDRLRTVGTIASSLAHELGTPLNVLLLRGQSIAAGEVEPSELRETGNTITAQVEKMSKIVRQILDFSRRVPSKDVVQLSDVAKSAAGLLSTLARKANVDLSVEVIEEVAALGEAVALEQAVTNLVVNALHAMPNGGRVSLRVGVTNDARGSVAAPLERAGFLEVRDEGVGMGADELARIFEPFYTTRSEGIGTGLGLTVARGIVEDHGGWISAKSEPEHGSTFTIFVPAHT